MGASDHHPAQTVQAWPYAVCFVVFPLVLFDYFFEEPFHHLFLLVFVFVIIPILDALVGLDDFNPTVDESMALDQRIAFRLVTWLWLPAQALLVWWGCREVALRQSAMSAQQYTGLVLGVGVVAGLSINCAHELIHKLSAFERAIGQAMLTLGVYPHWSVEHVYGHHKRVSTFEDPASARLGESFYVFWLRSVSGSCLSAFRLRFGLSCLYWSYTATLVVCIHQAYGANAVRFFVLQGVVGATLLEMVNYIEHYGLTRAPHSKVTHMHSWNAGHRVTNYFLFKLQRHSDHHAHVLRRYQSLRSWPDAPQLPQGYAAMIVLALFPPFFFQIMDPRVAVVADGKDRCTAEELAEGVSR